ncbi:MAG: hypothetical protein A2077_04935 [Nitrospirae bacterium GWC2_46_6]|nr:MAG: hypothetical protein A2Z82_11065 [Nitrospirae bacterium GWA2_46_11]OGW20266.1 MAG: hypothetical protein A2077_04935 [Nitrospirae bacterium GWC2_46_6]OGW22876.1 MAG: hypothetical protein A2X55_10095 [Nitrospirae bacterium GWB2_47_37]HAK89729.1 PIN domain nuclease [Nitrospiraceae bacterium]HCL82273.1 PIN domain nuclease [Nitrospiraceae bacterium]
MSKLVVDASVAIKWYVPEVYSKESIKLLSPAFELYVPDLLFSEIGNILWKHRMKGELSREKSQTIIAAISTVLFSVATSHSLMLNALNIACKYHRTFYDSVYIALAEKQNCRFVTADLKLYNALKNGPLKKYILWVEDIPNA